MAYSPEDRTRIVSEICALISNGLSLRKALKAQKDSINKESFYYWLDEDENKAAQYARACDERVEFMADEIIEISDFSANDTISTDKGDIPDNEWINRSKLRVDTRKWLMSKMRPSKYGDKVAVDHTTKGDKINPIDLSKYTDEELKLIAELQRKGGIGEA